MSEVTNSTETVSNETANEQVAKDPDRWDDEPEEKAEDPGDEQPEEKPEEKPEPKAKAKKQSKEEKAEAEKKEAEQRERRLRKLKIDGKEELIDEEEAIKAYAKSRTADKRLAEAAEAQKRLDAFREQFEKDPLAILNNQNLPINRRELAERWLKEAIEEELKDPVVKKLEEKDAELQRYKEAEEQARKKAQEAEMAQKASARKEEMARVFSEAMEKTVFAQDQDNGAAVLREMAMYARIAKEADPSAPLPSPEELATHVENQRLKQYHAVARTLSGDQLIQFMGEEIVNKIRKADLERLKKQRGINDQPETVKSDSWSKDERKPQKSERKYLDPVSAREEVRKRLGLA